MKCSVCKKEIKGVVPISICVEETHYPLCSSLCYSRFEEELGKFKEKRGNKKSWPGSRKKQ